MQIKQLEYARTIAETGSITQAAQKLFISQQALSETLKLLEAELGFQIFKRSNKGVLPTQAGEIFLHDLDTILPVVDGWKRLVKEDNTKQIVKIFVQYILSDLLVNSNFIERLESVGRNVAIEYEALDAMELLERIVVEKCGIGLVHLATSAVEVHQKLDYHVHYFITLLFNSGKIFDSSRCKWF